MEVDLAAVRRIVAKASRGPWRVDPKDGRFVVTGSGAVVAWYPNKGPAIMAASDAGLIASAPTLLVQLADEVEELRAALQAEYALPHRCQCSECDP